jgi:hypothetical protein
VPIFLEQEEANQFEDFCHEVLKPVFHFVQPTSNEMCQAYDKRGKDGSKWQLYCSVNLKFVKPVVQHFNDGDFVFAFDLELMMTPTLVGSRARSAQICFFFNTPFPSSEIFRALPVRKEVRRADISRGGSACHKKPNARMRVHTHKRTQTQTQTQTQAQTQTQTHAQVLPEKTSLKIRSSPDNRS